MFFYGFEWRYGAGVREEGSGNRCGGYVAFPSRKLRDEWVAEGNPYQNAPGARDAISSRDPELRRVLLTLTPSDLDVSDLYPDYLKGEPVVSVFSLTCEQCDAGMHINTREQAEAEGWTDIEYVPRESMANYIGMCPDCRAAEEAEDRKGVDAC